MSRARRWLGLGAVGALSALLALGASTVFWSRSTSGVHADPAPTASRTQEALDAAQNLSLAFEQVASTIRPSVVSINSTKRVHNRQGQMGDMPFREFFGDDWYQRFFGPGRDFEARGLGTGVIIGSDGTILTNNHVVDGADEVTVQLADETKFTAKVVGTDPKTDLAVLRIDAKNLQPAKLGDSEALKIGEWVLAAGNPFGLTASISAGIVSAKGRNDVGVADYTDFIQTDAAINPGNSGGPLVNLRGEVVGINTAIYTQTGGYMGIGFAIPMNMAKTIMTSLIQEGRVVRGWLGVQIQNLDEDLAKSFRYEGTDGVLVSQVMPRTPASQAGMQDEDIITRFGGKKVDNVTELRTLVAATRPGTSAEVEVWRDGRNKTLRVKVDEQESAESERPHAEPASLDLGLSVRTLTPERARRAGLEEETDGVLVTEVEPLSAASKAGLREGDIILSVQGKQVATVEAFDAAIAKADLDSGARLAVRRGNGKQILVLKSERNAPRG